MRESTIGRVASLVTHCQSSDERPLLSLDQVESGTGRLVPTAEVPVGRPPETGYAEARPGDVLFGKLRPYLAKSFLVDRPSYASTEFLCLRPLPGTDSRWLAYVSQSRPFVEWATATADGTKMPRTSWERLRGFRVVIPPLAQQRAIADFLDTETARIDALIAQKRRLIELLDAMRMSIVTDGVRGVLAGIEQEATKLPWLESRAVGWREAKLTLVARLGTGHTPSRKHPEWWVDCTIPWITTGDVAQMRSDQIEFITNTREAISELGLQNSSAVVHPAGTVVLCRTASAGYSAIMGCDMATSQDFVTWTCGPLLLPRYLLLCLRAMRQDLLGRLAMGSTHKTIYMPDIESLRIPLPSVAQQESIVEDVWGRLGPIHQAMDAISKQIDLLVEHRHALITAAVTGELSVPGVAA